ncbi:hypothetical protein LCGC14_2822560, partial [marine sediment metagenome]
HKGMRAMFTMMNEARLGVGLQGYAQGAVAYQNALGFARDRLQGRDVTGAQNPEGPADPIIVHPDVRRNLMDQKSFVEGARAFTFWGASLIDRAHRNKDAEADAMISLLTPVLKGFLTDKGFETTVLAQQTLGGSGFTREWGLEQFVRDARITMIYEGTSQLQVLAAVRGVTSGSFEKWTEDYDEKEYDDPLLAELKEELLEGNQAWLGVVYLRNDGASQVTVDLMTEGHAAADKLVSRASGHAQAGQYKQAAALIRLAADLLAVKPRTPAAAPAATPKWFDELAASPSNNVSETRAIAAVELCEAMSRSAPSKPVTTLVRKARRELNAHNPAEAYWWASVALSALGMTDDAITQSTEAAAADAAENTSTEN